VPPVPPDREDRSRIERLLAGDEAAFAALMTELHPSLGRLARAIVGSAAVAEDVVQETWLAMLEGLAGFEGRSSLKTWIFRILVNRCYTRAEREGRTVPFSALGDPDDPEDAVDQSRFDAHGMWTAPPERWDTTTPEAIVAQKEALEALEQAIAALPERQRIVLVLHDVLGWEPEEICNVLELAETNQRVLLHRARSKVRAALARHEGKR
jgi:RNA polymerase sigma-70 factor (ECF subfamily)